MGAIHIPADAVKLEGDLFLPSPVRGVVLFAHGSGSSRLSPRNLFVAQILQQRGIGTLLFDLLTREEDQDDTMRFDMGLLTQRLIAATTWLKSNPEVQALPLGYFGASTGAAAALQAAAELGKAIAAVVSRVEAGLIWREIVHCVRLWHLRCSLLVMRITALLNAISRLSWHCNVPGNLSWCPVQRTCSKSPGHWKRLQSMLLTGF